MKKLGLIIAVGMLVTTAFAQTKVITKTGHIKMFSHTVAEDINANNYKVVSTLDPTTGALVFSVPMQGFEFEKAAMQKHYNSPKFVDTKQFPKAKFKGEIINLANANLTKDGVHKVTVRGELTMHGVTKGIEENGTITVKGGVITANSTFKLTLADYKVAFEKGKPSTNIAKEICNTIKEIV